MTYFLYFFVFILGILIGSFLNVVILRYGTNLSIIYNHSRCFSCGKNLRWFELIPIFSFVFQRGRCRECGSKISWQYIVVEILTGVAFLAVFIKILPFFTLFHTKLFFFFYLLIFYWITFSILIAISVYDFKHKIIPNGLVYTFIVLTIIGALSSRDINFMLDHLIGGLIIAFLLFTIWFLSRGRAMGFGDVKLSLGIGLLLGLQNGIYALVWSFWIGGIVGILLIIFSKFVKFLDRKKPLFLGLKSFTIKSEIPFGPFLVIGTFIAFIFKWDFLNLDIIFKLLGFS